MPKSSIARWGATTSAAALALGTVVAAQAYETKMTFNDVSIVFDTTVSMGGSIRTAERETQFLNEGNGGAIDPRGNAALGAVLLPGAVSGTGTAFSFAAGTAQCPLCTNVYTYTLNPDNYDGSLNADDGRLNFDNGDLIGANVKANHDLQISWQNYKFFARAVGFYDVLLNSRDAGERSDLIDQALGDVGRNYELLDAFVSADYTIADLPVNLRVGKQVINWGESTFILNGINVFNPIDVNAFRRPGAEIKEGLVPVNAIYGSVSLPFDVSLAGYYALDWEPFELDPSGTPFSTVDIVTLGSGFGGNRDRWSIVTGGPLAGVRRNCSVSGTNTGTRRAQLSGLIPDPTTFGLVPSAAGLDNNQLDCSDSQFVSHVVNYTIGQHEAVRWGLIDTLGADDGVTQATQALLGRGDDDFGVDSGQYGLSARYYAESLGGTEFSVYFQNYHSRLPFVSERSVSNVRDLGYFVFGEDAQATAGGIGNRSLPPGGCLTAGSAALTLPPATTLLQAFTNMSTALNPAVMGAAAVAQMQDTPIIDAGNALPTANAAVFAALGVNLYNDPTHGYKNQYTMAQVNCLLTWYQSSIRDVNGAGTGPNIGGIDILPQMANGGELYNAGGSGAQVYIDYPEDIQMLGGAFNTTLWGWGVQGEITYRPNAPFQIDTDSVTIALLADSCIFNGLFAVAGNTVNNLATAVGDGGQPACGRGQASWRGYIENEMFTAQIGTTSTFAASEWWIESLGADLGVLVTEAGLVYVPGVEDTWLDKYDPDGPTGPLGSTYRGVQYQNIGCQGSDLPAGGILALDVKTSAQCRPNDISAGLVMLFRLEYNNAFDTGYVISPQIVYSYDFEGTTPAPYGNFLEDRQAIGLSVSGTLNNNFRVGVSYSNFFGGHVNNKAKDQDFASITASYSF